MGKFVILSLEYCPYSKKAEELFNNSNTSNKIIKIPQDEKDDYKVIMSTFPQIYYITNNDIALLGGLDNFKEMLNTNKVSYKKKPKLESTTKSIKKKILKDF